MKVALISPEYPPHTNWGGIATFNQNLTALLVESGHEVHIFTYDPQGNLNDKSIKKYGAIHYVSLKHTSWWSKFLYHLLLIGVTKRLLRKKWAKLFFVIDWNFFVFFAFRKNQLKKTFDVIHSSTYQSPALLISMFYRKIPHLQHLHGTLALFSRFSNPSLEDQVLAKIELWYMRTFSTKIISCSTSLLNETQKLAPAISHKTVVIPNFINRLPLQNKITLNKNSIVFFGRKEWRKGVDIIVDVFLRLAKINSKIHLYLIGDEGTDIRYQGKHLNFSAFLDHRLRNTSPLIAQRITSLPHTSNRVDLFKTLHKLKGVAVFPSRYEPFGYSMLEAMAIGFLTVISSEGGGPEIVGSTNLDMVVRPKTNEVFEKLQELVSFNSHEQQKYLARQQTILKRFTAATVKELYAKVYSEVCQ